MTNNPGNDKYSDIDQAEQELREAIKQKPDTLSYYLDLAQILWDKGNLSEAMELLTQAKERFRGPSERLIQERIEKITQIEAFWQDVVRAMAVPKIEEVPTGYCGHEESEELLEERLWEYADGLMSEDEEEGFWSQLQGCRYCLTKLISIQRAFDKAQREPGWSKQKIMETMEKSLREKKLAALMAKFADLIKKSPAHLQKTFELIRQHLNDLLQETFTYPAPCFAPVFGEHRVTVMSPFGKVRYPIVFAWQPYEEADHYIISIEDTDWSCTTEDTRVEIEPGELELTFGHEYMWEVKVMKGDEVIEEENGFFSLPPMEEIKELEEVEHRLKELSPEEDKLILWAVVLEEKEFYMEAIEKYKQAYDAIEPSPGIAYRIAYCYDKLELEELRDEWNRKILEED